MTVDDTDQRQDRARAAVRVPLAIVAEITPWFELDIRPGELISASVKATDVTAYTV